MNLISDPLNQCIFIKRKLFYFSFYKWSDILNDFLAHSVVYMYTTPFELFTIFIAYKSDLEQNQYSISNTLYQSKSCMDGAFGARCTCALGELGC